LVSPSAPPTPGQVSLLTKTDPPSSVVYSGSSFTPRSRYSALFFCTSTTCQPKCQIAVCGVVGVVVFTLLNNTYTLPDLSAGAPANVDFSVLGNCRV